MNIAPLQACAMPFPTVTAASRVRTMMHQCTY